MQKSKDLSRKLLWPVSWNSYTEPHDPTCHRFLKVGKQRDGSERFRYSQPFPGYESVAQENR
jgi:hypothetical protein